MTRVLATLIALAAVSTTPVGAILVIPMTFEQLVDEAAAVVYARVAEVRGQWTLDRQSIDSIVTLEALQYVKGDLGSTVAMRLPGGEAGGRIQVIPGAPTLREGELVVLFLKARGPALLTPLGLGQGIFRVTRDARTATMLVTPPPLKESELGRVIRGAAERRALSVDAFFATVRDTARGQVVNDENDTRRGQVVNHVNDAARAPASPAVSRVR
jgi:hypothetical protein